MKIAIEAQRIFRSDKHGMDFVILETLKELQKRKDGNHYYIIRKTKCSRVLKRNVPDRKTKRSFSEKFSTGLRRF